MTLLKSYGLNRKNIQDVLDRMNQGNLNGQTLKSIMKETSKLSSGAKRIDGQPNSMNPFNAVSGVTTKQLVEKLLSPALSGIEVPKRVGYRLKIQATPA